MRPGDSLHDGLVIATDGVDRATVLRDGVLIDVEFVDQGLARERARLREELKTYERLHSRRDGLLQMFDRSMAQRPVIVGTSVAPFIGKSRPELRWSERCQAYVDEDGFAMYDADGRALPVTRHG